MAGIFCLAFAVAAFYSCVYLDDIFYETTLIAGENAEFTVNMHISTAADSESRLIFSVLVPKSWNTSANSTVTFTDTYDNGKLKTMSLVPVETSPKNQAGLTWEQALKNKYGVGPNVNDNMEWVTCQSDEVFSVKNGDNQSAEIKLVIKVGEDNLRAKLGFFVNYSDDGLGTNEDCYKVKYTDCIDVVDGDDAAYVDYCERHFNAISPFSATKDDIFTITFQGDVAPNDLDNLNEIYLCAKVYTDAMNEYSVSEKSAKTLMKKETGRTFSLTFWPAAFFNIPDGEEIVRIDYYFTNKDGNMSVLQTYDDDTPPSWFSSPFICK